MEKNNIVDFVVWLHRNFEQASDVKNGQLWVQRENRICRKVSDIVDLYNLTYPNNRICK